MAFFKKNFFLQIKKFKREVNMILNRWIDYMILACKQKIEICSVSVRSKTRSIYFDTQFINDTQSNVVDSC